LSGDLVGFPGDYMSMPDGTQSITIGGPSNYNITLDITVQGSQVAFKQQKATSSNLCADNSALKTVRWDPPAITVDPAPLGATHFALKTPLFPPNTIQTLCFPLVISCLKSFGILNVDSDPTGGDIWIDGQHMQDKTNARLSVPFCESGNGNVEVLVRMPNRVNCTKQVTMQQGAEQTTSCHMSAP
jgi:hypothetical protein